MTREEKIKRKRERMIVFAVWTVLVAVVCGVAGRMTAPVETKETVKYIEVQEEHLFDNSVIENNWCGDFCDGTVRTVGAWWYADGVVEDEQGQLWAIEQTIEKEDFLLLWIADNNTPDKTTDDIVFKVWREAR